tara:strand:+ start:44 stop:1603 length:1560 start_codon:yes stop_codon:yes gene_type:complete
MTFTPSGFTPGDGLDEEFQRQLDLQKDDISAEQEFVNAQQGLQDANTFFQGLLSTAGQFTEQLDDLFGISETQFGKNYQTVRQIPKYSSGQIVQTSGGTLYRPDPGTMSSVFMSTTGGMGDLGIGNFGKRKKLTTPEFLAKRFQQYGFRKGPNGNYILDTKTYNALPTDAAKRDMAQIFQTAEDQTVPGSFNIEQTKQAPEFNAKYADYLRKYKGKPELHHSFPSAMSVRFWLDEEYMGENWQELKAVANEYGNYPGQPMTEGQSNLITVPSKTTKGAPNHLHNIIHNEFFTNEVGQRGQKFFTKERLAKMEDGIDGKIEVFREWNEIVRRNRLLTNEAINQLEALYSKGTFAENPEKVTSMLEEYLGTGKVKIGQSKVGGNVVDYSQMSVSDTISNALSDFVNDVKLEFLGTDSRFKEVETAIKEFGLSEGEQLQATELLYDIKSYNSIKLSAGARRAQIVTGITKQQHKNNLAAYKNLIQLKLPLDNIPTDSTLESTVFKDTKLPKLEKQLELIFND